ncbi:MAG: TIGR01212 family radical SAM protein [Sphaerochaetaceae bacterium]|nr:TIGR01212 family radical SAM protein [Sphaerochaetaceae bacterium]
MMWERWNDYTRYLINRYGRKVYRIGLDGGFSCPHRINKYSGGCIYCDSQGASSVYQRVKESGYTRQSHFEKNIDESLPAEDETDFEQRLVEIDEGVKRGKAYLDRRFPDTGRSIYFQSYTNTYVSVDHLRLLYDRALATGDYTELIISTRPDCLSDPVIELLSSYREKVSSVWVELGLQSGNEDSLKFLNRGHTVASYIDAVHRLRDKDIEVSTHMILGIPGEGDREILNSADLIREVHPEAVKIHNLNVVASTKLYEMYKKGEVDVPNMGEHIYNTILFLRHIPEDIVIQRLMSETPRHRLAAPRDFPDKGYFLTSLDRVMKTQNAMQGDRV